MAPRSALRDPIGAFNELYASFLFANASRLSKVESTARSLCWFVPAQSLSSEALFTSLNLLALYHDALSNRSPSGSPSLPSTSTSSMTVIPSVPPSAHARYTKYWLKQSRLYKATARLLSVISYAQLLIEMAGRKYKGEQGRWNAVIALESIKAVLRLALLRLTKQRTVLQPCIPEREIDPAALTGAGISHTNGGKGDLLSSTITGGSDEASYSSTPETWKASRTGFEVPTIASIRAAASGGDSGIGMQRVESEISAFLQKKVLTIDSVRRPYDLVRKRQGMGAIAEVVWIMRPLVYVLALKRYGKRSLYPLMLSLALEYFSYHNMAETLRRSPSSSTSEVEKQELAKRQRAFWLYFLRGPTWDGWTRGKLQAVQNRLEGVPLLSMLGNIAGDYRSLIDDYHYYSSS